MVKPVPKKEWQKALELARKLEKNEPLSKEKVVNIYEQGIKQAEKLKKFLKPTSWIELGKKPKKK